MGVIEPMSPDRELETFLHPSNAQCLNILDLPLFQNHCYLPETNRHHPSDHSLSAVPQPQPYRANPLIPWECLTILQPSAVSRASMRFFRVNHSFSLIIDVTHSVLKAEKSRAKFRGQRTVNTKTCYGNCSGFLSEP
jgi:hypothetical protein